MIFISFFILIVVIVIVFVVYCKLTTGICKCSKHLVGKTVIVTGANAGIGFETAKDLAARGARVILACRTKEKAIEARDLIIASSGNSDVHFKRLDLASLASVRAFADDILKTEKRLDILINNAGVLAVENVKTEDGLALNMQSNHFGPFLLTCLLLPLLKASAPSRIVNVSSMGHKGGKIDFDNLNNEKETEATYGKFKTYKNSKLCNVLMTVELARRLDGTGVTSNCLHPGAILTDIGKPAQNWLRYLIPIAKCVLKSPWEGAQTTIYLAVSPEVEGVSGKYYSDCQEAVYAEPARDKELARKLWEVSEKLVGLKE